MGLVRLRVGSREAGVGPGEAGIGSENVWVGSGEGGVGCRKPEGAASRGRLGVGPGFWAGEPKVGLRSLGLGVGESGMEYPEL